MNGRKTDIEPEIELTEEDEDASLPESEEGAILDLGADAPPGSLAAGRAAILREG